MQAYGDKLIRTYNFRRRTWTGYQEGVFDCFQAYILKAQVIQNINQKEQVAISKIKAAHSLDFESVSASTISWKK